jgi:hypothetical protein
MGAEMDLSQFITMAAMHSQNPEGLKDEVVMDMANAAFLMQPPLVGAGGIYNQQIMDEIKEAYNEIERLEGELKSRKSQLRHALAKHKSRNDPH